MIATVASVFARKEMCFSLLEVTVLAVITPLMAYLKQKMAAKAAQKEKELKEARQKQAAALRERQAKLIAAQQAKQQRQQMAAKRVVPLGGKRATKERERAGGRREEAGGECVRQSTSRQFLGGARAPCPLPLPDWGEKKKKESGHTMPLVRCRGWHQASLGRGGGSRGHVRARRLSGESALPAHPHFAQADLRYTVIP